MTLFERFSSNFYCFLGIFCTCSVLQNMVGSFLTTGIQSIERQFQISSSKSGLLMSASRFSYIPTVLLLAYFGNKGNRARWIGGGSLTIAFGCLLAALPNFIFPPKSAFMAVDTKFVLNALIRPVGNFTPTRSIYENPILQTFIPTSLRNEMVPLETTEDFDQDFIDTVDRYFKLNNSIVSIESGRNKTQAVNHTFNFQLIRNLQRIFPANISQDLLKSAEYPFGFCNSTIMKLKAAVKKETCAKRKADVTSNTVAYGMVFMALCMFGIGQSMPWTLGTPLIDDHVKRKNAPFYFAAIRSIRILGPVTGMWMGAGCFKLYVTLTTPPGLTPSDPRWIGAWWLGFLIVGVILIIPSAMMFCFPKLDFKRKSKKVKEGNEADKETQSPLMKTPHEHHTLSQEALELIKKVNFIDEVKTFISSIGLCLKSPIYVGVLLGRLFDAFAFRGLHSFQAKFIENHYGQPQHQVSLFSGVVGALSYAGGLVIGSFIMRKFKLDGRRAAAYTMLCSFLSVVLTVSKVFLSCQSVNNAVGALMTESNLTSQCNQNCLCDKSHLYPVCSINGTPFFSPCHAGCTNFTLGDDSSVFSNCECVDGGDVSRDYCTSDCTFPLYLYYSITVLTGIIAGTSGIPNMLIGLRSVPHDVRSVAMAFSGFLVSLLSVAPSTIVIGTVIDSACLLANDACGRKGACLLYDARVLRIRIHSIYGILRVTGLLFDVWVWYWAANLIMLKDRSETSKAGRKRTNSQTVPTDNKLQNN